MSRAPSAAAKEALCYQCALRMSMLYHYAPPRTLSQLLQFSTSSATAATAAVVEDAEVVPVTDDEHHPLFTIVHETAQSAQRYFRGALATDTDEATPPVETTGSTAHGMLGGDAAPLYAVSWLCVACMGLYQFIDLIHAPLAAAAVRASPYYDSEAISINVNVNRSFTFTWLAVATRYFDLLGTGEARPPASSVVKEELSNFKDFYMSDLRARILPYLLHPHDAVVDSRVSPAGIGRVTPLPGIAVYTDAVAAALLAASAVPPLLPASSETEEESRVVKRARTEPHTVGDGSAGVPSSAVTPAASCEALPPSTPPLLLPPPTLVALQAFRYSGTGESLVGEVFCRHHATEGLITEGHMPAVFCGNRSTEVLPYSVIYDYAVPYLVSTGWMPPAGALTAAAGAAPEDDGHLAALVDRRTVARQAAAVSCELQHANVYLMGSYRKMMRNMSQSPWFLNAQRIGSFSLQEVIANPLLPFFYPDMPDAPPETPVGTSGSGVHQAGDANGSIEAEKATAATTVVERGAHANRWQAVAPSVASAALVFGYNRYKFHSAGREDVDVRMLGGGRPFVLELVSPMRERFTDTDLRRLESCINSSYEGSVEVSRLRRTDADITVRLARHSESKVKRYRCVVWCSRTIEDAEADPHVQAIHAMRDLSIEQKTPLRVLHRRSLHPRPRLIHSMRLTPLNAHWFLLDLETQAGTYVKEFVHGDMGRTTPHLGMLLNARADIIQLDVVGMTMEDLDQA